MIRTSKKNARRRRFKTFIIAGNNNDTCEERERKSFAYNKYNDSVGE